MNALEELTHITNRMKELQKQLLEKYDIESFVFTGKYEDINYISISSCVTEDIYGLKELLQEKIDKMI